MRKESVHIRFTMENYGHAINTFVNILTQQNVSNSCMQIKTPNILEP